VGRKLFEFMRILCFADTRVLPAYLVVTARISSCGDARHQALNVRRSRFASYHAQKGRGGVTNEDARVYAS